MRNKRGFQQVDWAISIAIFILYLSWFFILLKPHYIDDEKSPVMDNLNRDFLRSVYHTINKTPIMVYSRIDTYSEPVVADYKLSVNESNLAFTDKNYYVLHDGKIYFLTDLKKGVNNFEFVSSEYDYEKKNIHTDLLSSDYSASVTDMKVDFHDSLITRVHYKGKIIIDDLEMRRLDQEITADDDSKFDSKIFTEWVAETNNDFNHTATIFAENQRIYNEIKLDSFVRTRSVDLSMKIRDMKNYYSDNSFFGKVEFPIDCFEYDSDKIFFYDDYDVLGFVFQNETDLSVCYSSDGVIQFNASITADGDYRYRIFFEPLAVVKNGEFDQGWKYWSFVNNSDVRRNCTSREGIQVLINDSSDPYLLGDWENSTGSGFPVAGFGSNATMLTNASSDYDGRLLSAEFEIPEYADLLHVWRHFKLESFDYASGLFDAVYLEIVDADTLGWLYTIDEFEASGYNQDYDLTGEKIVNLSSIRGKKVRLSLHVIGGQDSDPNNCQDGSDGSLVQIDDTYFSDQSGNKVYAEFNSDEIMSRYQDIYEIRYGVADSIKGISKAKLEALNNLSYLEQKNLWKIPIKTDFNIMVINST